MQKYWLASRPYSFTAAIVPAVLGAACARLLVPNLTINWLNLLLVILGCITAQAISNLVNDLVDFRNGTDTKDSVGRHNALLAGTLTVRQMFLTTVVLAAVSLAIGLYFAWVAGPVILYIVLAGGVLALEYTAPPLSLKYHALGDLTVLLTFGLGMVFGSYYVQAHAYPGALGSAQLIGLMIYNLPSALLVVAILHANNHRDRETDGRGGGRTLANSLSFPASKNLLVSMLVAPYVIVLVAVGSGFLIPWVLITALSLPSLLKIIGPIKADDYRLTVPKVAQLHGQFGLLMGAGILADIVIHRGQAGH